MQELHPLLLSDIFGVPEMYKHVFYTWCAMLILFGIGIALRSKMKLVPTGLQNVMETIIGGLEDFTVSTIGERGRKYFPLLGGIFLFVIVQNLLGLVPGCDAPTANINTDLAMALFVFLYYNYLGLRSWGPRYIKHFMGPMAPLVPLMLPIEVVSHLSRPLSLTFRLFGNIRGEEIVLALFFLLAPLVATLPIYFLFLLAKCMQAFIFYMLTMVYIQGALEEAH